MPQIHPTYWLANHGWYWVYWLPMVRGSRLLFLLSALAVASLPAEPARRKPTLIAPVAMHQALRFVDQISQATPQAAADLLSNALCRMIGRERGSLPEYEGLIREWSAVQSRYQARLYLAFVFDHAEKIRTNELWDDFEDYSVSSRGAVMAMICDHEVRQLLKQRLSPEHYARWQSNHRAWEDERLSSWRFVPRVVPEVFNQSIARAFDRLISEAELRPDRVAELRPKFEASCLIENSREVMKSSLDALLQSQSAMLLASGKGLTPLRVDRQTRSRLAAGTRSFASNYFVGLLTPVERDTLTKRRAALDAEYRVIAKDQSASRVAMTCSKLEHERESRLMELKSALNLPDERCQQILGIIKAGEKSVIEVWQRGAELVFYDGVQQYLKWDDQLEESLARLRAGNMGFPDSVGEARFRSSMAALEKAAVEQVLSTGELEQFEALKQANKAAIVEVVQLLVMAELDRILLLTADQRMAIEVLATPVVQSVAGDAFLAEFENSALGGVTCVIHGVGLSKIEPLLDDRQQRTLKKLASSTSYRWDRVKEAMTR
jgi:hypothetical protein